MKQKKQEKAGKGRTFAVIFENVFLFGLLRSVVRMLRTSGTRRNTREYEAIHQQQMLSISIAGAAAAAAIHLLLMFSFIFPRVPSVFFYSLVILIFHEIFKNLAVVQRHHITPRKWQLVKNSFRSFYDPLNFMKSYHFLGVIWCLCTAERFLNIS